MSKIVFEGDDGTVVEAEPDTLSYSDKRECWRLEGADVYNTETPILIPRERVYRIEWDEERSATW